MVYYDKTRIYPQTQDLYVNYKSEMDSFYKNLSSTNFSGIKKEKLQELRKTGIDLYKLCKARYAHVDKRGIYTIIMNKIKTTPKTYNVESDAEKFILFMFTIDPNFESAKIYGESNHIDEVKLKMEKHFGLFDSKLISIEKFFIKHFLSEKSKNKINEEITDRAFDNTKKVR